MGCGKSQAAEPLGIKKIPNDYLKPQITSLQILKDSEDSTLYNATLKDGQDYIIKKFAYTENSQLLGAIKLQGNQFIEIVNIYQDLKNIYVVTKKINAKPLLEYCSELVNLYEFQIIELVRQLKQIFQRIINSGIKHLQLYYICRNFNLNKILIYDDGKIVITDYYFPCQKYWNFDFFFPPDWNHDISHVHQINEQFYVYQIGIISYLLLTGEIPDPKKLSSNSIKNIQASTHAKDFLSKTLNQDPFVRIQLNQLDQCKWFQQYENQHLQNKLKETNNVNDQSIINWKYDTYYHFKIFYLLLDYIKSVTYLKQQLNQIREEIFDLNLVEAMERGVIKSSNYLKIINNVFNQDQIKVQRFSLNITEVFDSEQYLESIEMLLLKQYQKYLQFFEKNELIDMEKIMILRENFNQFREIYRPMLGNPEVFLSKTSQFLLQVNSQTKFQKFVDIINSDL